jgi:hypothetical protein
MTLFLEGMQKNKRAFLLNGSPQLTRGGACIITVGLMTSTFFFPLLIFGRATVGYFQ